MVPARQTQRRRARATSRFCRVAVGSYRTPLLRTSLLGSDRGPELWNLCIQELEAILGIVARPGTGWRPVEQAPVEREHQEFRRLEGAFIQDIFKAYGPEWD